MIVLEIDDNNKALSDWHTFYVTKEGMDAISNE